jgi:psp operon transcriptional activator
MATAQLDAALGQSEAFLELQEALSRAAKTERPVILIGERGTGKELAASRLHLLSRRWGQPYVTLNCAALAPTLLESELFGHEAGAFTGALRQRKGRFEQADGGTLFLDEVGNIPLTAQEKILRAIEYGQFERVGGGATLACDVRLIAATNVDLRAQAEAGRFRHDLLDRLSFEVLTLPPLRARGEDVWILAQHFARQMARELGLAVPPPFTPAARKALLQHAWPGNIRELKNTVERMVYRCAEGVIEAIVFDPFESPWAPAEDMAAAASAEPAAKKAKARGAITPGGEGRADPGRAGATQEGTAHESAAHEGAAQALLMQPLGEAVRTLELLRVREALTAARYHQREAAERLGLTYHQFRALYRKYQTELKEGE